MKAIPVLFLSLATLMVFSGCRDRNEDEKTLENHGAASIKKDSIPGSDRSEASMTAAAKPKQIEDTLAYLLQLAGIQHRAMHASSDLQLRKKLLGLGIDSAAGAVFSAGKALGSDSLPAAVRAAGRRRAAKQRALRNAAVTASIYRGDTSVFIADDFHAKVAYTQHLFSAEKNDTLLLLYKTPLGSIELDAD